MKNLIFYKKFLSLFIQILKINCILKQIYNDGNTAYLMKIEFWAFAHFYLLLSYDINDTKKFS